MPAQSLYVSDRELARMLGHAIDWLKANRDKLEQQFGFPKVDPAIGKTHREAVEEWARKRNARDPGAASERLNRDNRENLDAL